MRFGTVPEYGCEVVCKVTVLVDHGYCNEYRTFTGSCLDALKRTVTRMFPKASLTFGEPMWVQR